MVIKRALHAPSASIRLSLHFSVPAFRSPFQSLALRPAQPCCGFPTTFSGAGNSSPTPSTVPSLSCTFVPSFVMPRRHRMRCRRAGGRGLPSIPPLSNAMGRESNLSMGLEEPSRLEHVNLSAQLSFQLPISPPASSGIRPKKRPRKSTVPPKPTFIPRKMKALPVQSGSSSSSVSSDGRSSNSDAGGKEEDTSELVATSKWPYTSGSPRLQATIHALNKEDDDSFYVCRIEEGDPNPSKKNDGPP